MCQVFSVLSVLILYRKRMPYAKGTVEYRLQSFLSIQYVHGDLSKKKSLGIDPSTDRILIIRIVT